MEHTALPAAQQKNNSLVGETNPYTEPHEQLKVDDTVEIINRGPGGTRPFGDIEKNPSTTARGNLTGYGIELYDPEAEDNYRYIDRVSAEYMTVSNAEAVDLVHDEVLAESPFTVEPTKIYFDGKRFVYNMRFPHQDIEGPRGDIHTVGLQVRNSYNGAMRFQASLFAERLVCENGMTSTDHFSSHSFEHRTGNEEWEQELEQALSVLQHAPDQLERFVSGLYELEQLNITSAEMQQLRSHSTGLGELPVSRFGEVYDSLIGETQVTQPTGYDLMNAATRVLWHRDKSARDLHYNESVVEQLMDYANRNRN
jgi:hypothetical protein